MRLSAALASSSSSGASSSYVLVLLFSSLAALCSAQTSLPVSSATVSSNSALPTTFRNASISTNGTRPSNATFTTSTNTLVLQGTRMLTSSTSTTSAAGPPAPRASCNGYPEFCNRKYSNITEVCSHNSAFVRPNNLAANQAVPIIGQLNDGIRMIQGQTHYENGSIYACHTSCDLLNVGLLQDELATVKQWLDGNRYEVVTILLGNSDFITVENYTAPITNSGLLDYAYIPPKVPMNYSDWPTLSDMILSNKRAVIFMDYNANQTSVPYILDEFTHMWETPFSPTDISFPCTQGRPENQLPYEVMYLHNHNLNVQLDLPILSDPILLPNLAALDQVNSVNGTMPGNNTGSLGLAATQCTEQHGKPPRYLVVDYYNVGNGSVFEVAARLNNVTYNQDCCGLDLQVSAASALMSPRSLTAAILGVFWAWVLC